MRRIVAMLVVLVFTGVAGAEPYDSGKNGPSEVLLRAMQDELQRTIERLRLEDLARPHFVAYLVLETQSLELEGNFGGIERPRSSSTRRLQVEVRVGSREFDDSHFLDRRGQGYRPLTATLPVEDDYDALRAEIWTLTDRAYKAALERLARKTVYRDANNIREVLPDLTEDPVVSSRETRVDAGWLSKGRLRQVFWVPKTLDLSARGVSQLERFVLLPHWLAQRVRAEGLLEDHHHLVIEGDESVHELH